jgi:hypothetical protein
VFKLAGNASAAQVAPRAEASPKSWPQVERRGPNRAKNVTRLAAKAAASATPAAPAKPVAKTGTDDGWTEF